MGWRGRWGGGGVASGLRQGKKPQAGEMLAGTNCWGKGRQARRGRILWRLEHGLEWAGKEREPEPQLQIYAMLLTDLPGCSSPPHSSVWASAEPEDGFGLFPAPQIDPLATTSHVPESLRPFLAQSCLMPHSSLT